MNDNHPKPITDLLQPNLKELQTLLSKIRAISLLNETVKNLLPSHLQKYCQVANLSNGILVMLTANGSAASELKNHLNPLLHQLHQTPNLRHIREIEVKVRPTSTPVGVHRGKATKSPTKPAKLTATASAAVSAVAETIEDPRLREIMKKIAGYTIK